MTLCGSVAHMALLSDLTAPLLALVLQYYQI
jgi:hypothetical protein